MEFVVIVVLAAIQIVLGILFKKLKIPFAITIALIIFLLCHFFVFPDLWFLYLKASHPNAEFGMTEVAVLFFFWTYGLPAAFIANFLTYLLTIKEDDFKK